MQVWEFCEAFMNSRKLVGTSVRSTRLYAITLGAIEGYVGTAFLGLHHPRGYRRLRGDSFRGTGPEAGAGARDEWNSPQPSIGRTGGVPCGVPARSCRTHGFAFPVGRQGAKPSGCLTVCVCPALPSHAGQKWKRHFRLRTPSFLSTRHLFRQSLPTQLISPRIGTE